MEKYKFEFGKKKNRKKQISIKKKIKTHTEPIYPTHQKRKREKKI